MGPSYNFRSKLGIEDRGLLTSVSFDDVTLLPGSGAVEPEDADISTWLTPEWKIPLPLLSSPMDLVTGVSLAVALAREGGLGILHRNCSIEEQAQMVERVKRAEVSGVIRQPVCARPDSLVGDVIALMAEYRISGLPVVEDGKLVGIVTRRDIIGARHSDQVKSIMTPREKLTVMFEDEIGDELDVEAALERMYSSRVEKLPVVDRGWRLTGLITLKDLLRMREGRESSRDEDGRLRVGAAIPAPLTPLQEERVLKLDEAGCDLLVLDVAHAQNRNVIKAVEKVSKRVSSWILFGNIATADAVEEVLGSSEIENLAGFRVGLGGGSICTTTVVTGVGIPTLTATALVADVVREKLGERSSVVSDGGIRGPGDAMKALAAGASAVMMGSVFAGAEEAPGDKVFIRGVPYKRYRGMASPSALRSRYAADRYSSTVKRIPEGIEGYVPYRGSVSSIVREFKLAIKAGMGYVGAASISQLWAKSRFVLRSQAGIQEAKPHTVVSGDDL